jgi:pantoate--beta-alanine ligase
MQIIDTISDLRAWSRDQRKSGHSVGLVPTMGALHQGHLSLVRTAKAQCEAVAASIFVNPTQFGPNEDFSKYPRTFEADCAMLEAEGVDVVFAPTPEEMYRPGATTFVEVADLSNRLDGASRPGHFRGVATVVSKLFLAAEPDKAFFGQKDAAQVAVLRQMTADLGLPVEIVVCPIVRESDGLAMSSRNRYLTLEQRRQALVLSQAILRAQQVWHQGETDASRLIEAARSVIAEEPAVRIDYIAAVDWQTLLPVTTVQDGTLLAIAANVGNTRLIDNFVARKPRP